MGETELQLNFKPISSRGHLQRRLPRVVATHCAGLALANGPFLVHNTRRDLDPRIVRPEIVAAHHALKLANAGMAQRAADLVARIGRMRAFDLERTVLRVGVVDRLFLHLVHRRRLTVRLVRVREIREWGGGRMSGRTFTDASEVVARSSRHPGAWSMRVAGRLPLSSWPWDKINVRWSK